MFYNQPCPLYGNLGTLPICSINTDYSLFFQGNIGTDCTHSWHNARIEHVQRCQPVTDTSSSCAACYLKDNIHTLQAENTCEAWISWEWSSWLVLSTGQAHGGLIPTLMLGRTPALLSGPPGDTKQWDRQQLWLQYLVIITERPETREAAKQGQGRGLYSLERAQRGDNQNNYYYGRSLCCCFVSELSCAALDGKKLFSPTKAAANSCLLQLELTQIRGMRLSQNIKAAGLKTSPVHWWFSAGLSLQVTHFTLHPVIWSTRIYYSSFGYLNRREAIPRWTLEIVTG